VLQSSSCPSFENGKSSFLPPNFRVMGGIGVLIYEMRRKKKRKIKKEKEYH
jgi:hypothetical protein